MVFTKTSFIISLFLNAVLAGCLIFIWVDRPKTMAQPIPPASPIVRPVLASVPAPVEQRSTSVESAPFRWDQLYSKDYHNYVKNLRAIGCPEPTVRAIVTWDVDSVYRVLAAGWERKLAALDNGSWSAQISSASSEQALKDALQKIPDEESAKIADLLGLLPATVVASKTPAVPLAVPLVLQQVDLSTLKLDQSQIQAINDLKQSFLEKIGGEDQDTNDPAYRERWQTAQAEIDNLLQGMIGDQAYQNYQIEAEAYAEAQAKPTDNP